MKPLVAAILAITLLICPCLLPAAEQFPKEGWKDAPNPLAGTDAVVGGQITIFAGQYPKSLNYYLDNNSFTAEIFGAMFETLLAMNPLTLEYEPNLAEKWTLSDDKKTFTFTLDPRARWSDGRPVTAEDVKWTFDAIMDPKNLTGVHKVSLERFDSPTVLDSRTIRFTAKDVHWVNLSAVGGFHILPKHSLGRRDFNKITFEFPVSSGPYSIGNIDEGLSLTLERRSDWWSINTERNKNTGNFERLRFRFYAERENAFEAFKKGLIDLYPVYTSRLWVNETKGNRFSKAWIIKQKVFNSKPIGFQGFAMNMRKPPFDDVRVRQAMAHLLDRRKMNSTLMYSQYFLHKSYFEDLYDKVHPCPNPLIEFDKQKARKLLQEAGWHVNPSTGFLEKDGQRFSFRFLISQASLEKFPAIYAEDLKDVGIELIIDKKDWAAWARDMDEFNYEMTWASWGSGLFKNPEGMWQSKEADRRSGNNITGFKNSRVDRLIDARKGLFDIAKRNALYREIDQIIYREFPYVLLWNINYTRLLHWNKFGTPDTVLSKYGDETSAYWYWWIDADSRADLEDAMQEGLPLSPKEAAIYFDEVFSEGKGE
ncbi:MAG: ABC transporter substrate-binding protein [Deltaproteobacteria bacterium]|nr:ABC transporter substrate-binding protein [Deltaproteobacteria bacterium]